MTTVTRLPEPQGISETIKVELKVLLARAGQTQHDLAQVIGVSDSQMSKRMRGAIAFDVFELDALARHFGVSVASIVGGEARSPRPAGPGGGQACTRRDSNPKPSDPKVLAIVPDLLAA